MDIIGHTASCERGDWSATVHGLSSGYTLECAIQEHSRETGHPFAAVNAVFAETADH